MPTDNITELNKFIDAGAKLVYNKINILKRKQGRNTKPGQEKG